MAPMTDYPTRKGTSKKGKQVFGLCNRTESIPVRVEETIRHVLYYVNYSKYEDSVVENICNDSIVYRSWKGYPG